MSPLLILLVLTGSISSKEDITPIYKDPKNIVEKRVNDLLGRMTLKEKIAQLVAMPDSYQKLFKNGNFIKDSADRLMKDGICQIQGIIRMCDFDARKSAEVSNTVQRYFIENTRLGIPVIFSEECLHGAMARGATIFPQSIGLSCTWDTTLFYKIFTAIALETRTRGTRQALTPMLDVVREPRWGRIEESYGEDPYLISRYGVTVIKAFQGNNPSIDNEHIAATAKHFAAHGHPEAGLNKAAMNYSERAVRQFFLPQFKAAVQEAGVKCIMPAYHELDGVPCHGNKWLLTDVLRNEWGFKGLIVSDYGGVNDQFKLYKVVASKEEAAKKSLNAGVDVELPAPDCFKTLEKQVTEGLISESVINEAVKHVLTLKFEIGLFDNPYTDPVKAEMANHSKAHQELALEAARKTIVLLKNENHLLPLDKNKIKKLAVIGPNANRRLYGGYTIRTDAGFTILEGLKNRLGNQIELKYAEGCKIHLGEGYWKTNKIVLNNPENDRKMIAQAVATAKSCDAAIVVIGDDPALCSEGHDVNDLNLVGMQNELVKSILATGKPVIVVLLNGRPITINYIDANVPAILEGWLLGEECGNAVADVLFGDVNPSGKLTVTFPRSTGQLPLYYNQDVHEGGYVLGEKTPLYPFGYGLSYTTFSYSNLKTSSGKIKNGENVMVTVDVTNTGKYTGDEIVQLYIHDEISSLVRPLKELKDFARISLEPGKKKTVRFTISPAKLQFYNHEMKQVVEPGIFDIMVGTNSEKLDTVKLEIL